MNLRIPNCFGTYAVLDDGTIELSWFCRDRAGWARMLSLVRSIPRRVFDSETKKWYIPATEDNIESLQESGWRAAKKSAVKAEPQAAFGGVPVPKKYQEYMSLPEEVPAEDPVIKQRNAIENFALDSTRDIVPGLRSYQVDFLKFAAMRNGRVALGDGMGCVDGEEVVQVRRHRASKYIKLKDLYQEFHRPLDGRKIYTNEQRPWSIRCLHPDGTIRTGEIADVVDSGIKKCVEITLEDGKKLVLTPDHLIKTKDGWIEAGKSEGTGVLCNGTPACPVCGSTKNIITYPYSKFLGLCRKCMYDRRKSYNDKEIHEVVRNDGYVYIHGYPLKGYKGCRRTDGIPKHRYVMEQFLGRPLKSFEVVHHIDGNKLNNNISNLQLMTQKVHASIHPGYRNFGFVVPKEIKVVSVKEVGERHVYDVKVVDHGNFLANKIIVHNCGKTLSSLAWLAYNRSFPALVVVNAPTKLQWEKEFKRWLSLVPNCPHRVQILYGTRTRKLDKSCSYIVNWDILTYWQDELAATGFECLIGDEAQAIGNPESKRALAFRHLAAVIPECIVMSGTPARSRPAQFWTMVSCVEPKMFPTYKGYLWRYTCPKATPWGVQFDGARNVKELHAKLVSVMLRRTKDDVMKDLPPKTLDVIPLEADAAELAEYNSEEAGIAELQGIAARERLTNLTRTAYAVKEKSLLNWVRCFMESDEKLLLFAWHRDVVDRLFEELKEYNPAKIYGGVTLQQREAEKEKFIQDDSCRIMICNIQSGGTGVDGFQKVCCNVAFAEFASTSTDMEQAEDRLHRGGQERPVSVYYLIATGTIDEDMAEALDSKKKVLASVLDGKQAADLDLIATIAARRGLRI